MKKSQNCEIKSRNNIFFIFYSVAETGFHKFPTVFNKKKNTLFFKLNKNICKYKSIVKGTTLIHVVLPGPPEN